MSTSTATQSKLTSCEIHGPYKKSVDHLSLDKQDIEDFGKDFFIKNFLDEFFTLSKHYGYKTKDASKDQVHRWLVEFEGTKRIDSLIHNNVYEEIIKKIQAKK